MSAMATTATSLLQKSGRIKMHGWKNVGLSLKHLADSLVCRPCRDDIARVLANPAYIPRWRKGRVEGCSSYCFVKDCNSISFTQTSLCSSSDDLKIIHGIEFTTECIPIPTPLCKNHYHVLYDALQSRRKHCITCGRRLRPGNDRSCPQPHIIQIHLQTLWVIFLRMIVYRDANQC